MKPALSFCVALLAAALAGCSSIESPRGEIHVGDTPETVHRAMGNPDEKQDGPDSGGHQVTWIYANHHQERREKTGWSEILVPGVHDQNDTVVHEPVTHDVYRTQPSADYRVTFADGVVSSIEQRKR